MARQLTDEHLTAIMKLINGMFNLDPETTDYELVLIVGATDGTTPVKVLSTLDPDDVTQLMRGLVRDSEANRPRYTKHDLRT